MLSAMQMMVACANHWGSERKGIRANRSGISARLRGCWRTHARIQRGLAMQCARDKLESEGELIS
jgi:hypothetical protein